MQLQRNIESEASARSSADNYLNNKINTETVDRTAADDALSTRIGSRYFEATDAIEAVEAVEAVEATDDVEAVEAVDAVEAVEAMDAVAPTGVYFDIQGETTETVEVLGDRLDTEAATRSAADQAEAAARYAADVAIHNASIARDQAEAATRAMQDTAIRSEFRSADTAIINQANSDRKEYRGGIAAALAAGNIGYGNADGVYMAVGIAGYGGQQAGAIGGSYRKGDKAMRVAVTQDQRNTGWTVGFTWKVK